VEVPVVTLDNACAREGVEGIDILKADVEGHEIPVLRGANRLMQAEQIDMLAVEYNREAQRESGHDPRDLGRLLEERGWQVSVMTGAGLRRFNNDGSLPYAELICARTTARGSR
jgi:hypothetical protein